MSRFYLTVLVPGETPRDEIGLAVEELMVPYEGFDPCDEGLVEADQCRCGLVRARWIASWVADKAYPGTTSSEHPDRFLIRRLMLRSETIAQQLRHRLARPDCQFCHGSGVYASDFERPINFDGVAYGGAYETGWIRGQSRAVQRDEPEPTLEDNLSTVRELLELFSPIAADNRLWFTHSLLTPDGDWYSAPHGGLLMSPAEEEAFTLEFLRRLRDNLDCWAVGLECLV